MPEILNNFSTSQFIPHGHCYLWKPGLVGLHIASDALIALAYYSIPVMLVYLVYKRRDVPFHWMFLMFGAFIIACGTTHVMEIWTLWHPTYWLSGFIKVITAIISLYTASELVPLLPKILALPSPTQLKAANLALEKEITERKQAEQHIRTLNAELEQRVNERTAALRHSNEELASEIADHKWAEQQIKASLQEKEVLLKEIHHRVKNNLQIISSLLNLQTGYIEDEKTLEILKAGESRVASMAMIHEQLYLSGDLAKVNFTEYIENLVANLFNSYNVNSEAIALKINVDNVNLKLDAAIHCGLIINELISNSLKYAFPAGKEGEICIDFYRNNNHFILTVSDNGIGFPKDLDFHNTASLGLQIVTALTNQLEGMIELNRDRGTEFKILF